MAGVLQEVLQRLPEAGDEVEWPPFRFRVLESQPKMLLELELFEGAEERPLIVAILLFLLGSDVERLFQW